MATTATVTAVQLRQLAANIRVILPELLPVIYKQTSQRHGRTGNRVTAPTPINLTAMSISDEIRDTITTWAGLLARHANHPRTNWAAATPSQIAALIETTTQHATTWQDAPAMIDEITDALTRAARLIDPPKPLPLVGPCPVCRTAIYAPTRIPEPACPTCDTIVNRHELRAHMLDSVASTWAPSATALHIAHLLTGKRAAPSTLRTWAHRGLVRTQPGPRYSVHDIVQRLAAPNGSGRQG